MKTITTQLTQNSIDLPQAQPAPAIDPTIALLLYLSVLFPLLNHNLQHLLQLLTILQKFPKAWKRDRLEPKKRSKK